MIPARTMPHLGALVGMAHSPIHNYGGIPGLTSSLIGKPSEQGSVRLFECSREHQEPITPHSHRFDFQCYVAAGTVTNRIWQKDADGDPFEATELIYDGVPGKYRHSQQHSGIDSYSFSDQNVDAGQWYGMSFNQIHSIFFGRGAVVLFFEGPEMTRRTTIIQPRVDGETVPTFEVKPWAFKRPTGA